MVIFDACRGINSHLQHSSEEMNDGMMREIKQRNKQNLDCGLQNWTREPFLKFLDHFPTEGTIYFYHKRPLDSSRGVYVSQW